MQELIEIQAELKAPKGQRNTFGNYNYRSCEDILEALKPLLVEHECLLILDDDIVEIGGRVYVKATVKIQDSKGVNLKVSAFARESDTKKGMDSAQITGAASSYARKYALNGLFLIDDTKDADATNKHGKGDNGAKEPLKPPVDIVKMQTDKGINYIKKYESAQEALNTIGEQYHIDEVAEALITDLWGIGRDAQ